MAHFFWRCLVVAVLVVVAAPGKSAEAPADLILRHAAVYAMDPHRTRAQAVAIRGGRIVFVGRDDAAEAWRGPRSRVLDLDGKMVLPGFHDAHMHPVQGGLLQVLCNVYDVWTLEETLAVVRRYAASHPRDPWILGGGWKPTFFPGEGGVPPPGLLDRVETRRPVFLKDITGHNAWLNHAALHALLIDRRTPDPPHGRIERANGEPTGVLEEAAMDEAWERVPKPSPDVYRKALQEALRTANGFGITGLQEAKADDRVVRAFESLARAELLTARVHIAYHVEPSKMDRQLPYLQDLRRKIRHPLLHVSAAKIVLDGVVATHTASMLEPYQDAPGTSGSPKISAAEVAQMVTKLDASGFQVHVHAIGDRAVRMALDAFAAARRAHGKTDLRHHIAHLGLVADGDVPRFKALGVAANFQPFWGQPGLVFDEQTQPALGPRASRVYPLGTVARSGATIVAGSDWPVSSMNPLDAIEVALTRCRPGHPEDVPLGPEQRVDLDTILAAYTINGAWLEHEEKETGSIQVGKAADLVVLDRDLFSVPASEIHAVKVLYTFLEGRQVYRY